MLKEFQDMASFGPIARNHFKEAAREGYGVKDCTAILEYFDEKISNIAN
jgi:hypothetical protein